MDDPAYDTDAMRLARIERKINSIGSVVAGAIGIGTGFIAYKIATQDLGLGNGLGEVAAVATFLVVGYFANRDFTGR